MESPVVYRCFYVYSDTRGQLLISEMTELTVGVIMSIHKFSTFTEAQVQISSMHIGQFVLQIHFYIIWKQNVLEDIYPRHIHWILIIFSCMEVVLHDAVNSLWSFLRYCTLKLKCPCTSCVVWEVVQA